MVAENVWRFADRLFILQDSKLKPHTWSGLREQTDTSDFSAGPAILPRTAFEIKSFDDPRRTKAPRMNDAVDELSRKDGGLTIYGMISSLYNLRRGINRWPGYYMKAIGLRSTLLLIACTAGFSYGSTFAQYALKWATESPSESLMFYMSLYASVSLIAWVATSGTVW